MTAQAGNSILLKRHDGSSFVTVGAMRTKSIKVNGETVDITHDGSSGWRTLLEGAGVRSMSVTGNGVFDSASDQEAVYDDLVAGTHTSWELTVPGWATFTADFQVTDLEISGDANQEVTFSMSLESSGAITKADI